MATTSTPRERLLAAADELFYAEGIHTVGIDRVIEKAGVAKASLYNTFGSKDDLVKAYLEQRAAMRQARWLETLAKPRSPRGKILAIFDMLGEFFDEPGFRGCAFARATAEGAPAKVKKVCVDARAWTRNKFIELARDFNAKDPEQLGGQLHLLYDGAMLRAQQTSDGAAAETAKQIAVVLLANERPASRTGE